MAYLIPQTIYSSKSNENIHKYPVWYERAQIRNWSPLFLLFASPATSNEHTQTHSFLSKNS